MKPIILIPVMLFSITPGISYAATFEEVTTEGDAIGTIYLFDGNAGTGGNDYDSFGNPETGNFIRKWSLVQPGTTGIDLSITGLAFGFPGGSTHTEGNVITTTITYLGADGIEGGSDDLVLGSAKGTVTNFDINGAGRYECLFDSAITGNIDGMNEVFSVKLQSLEVDNGGSSYNMRFKTTSGSSAGAVKMDVAGTSTTSGTPLPDTDIDGILDIYETNTGIFVNKFDTGTDPNNDDTDDDDLLDGVETNTRKYVSASDTGTNPLDSDSDNDGLFDGVETNSGIYSSPSDTGTNPMDRDGDKDALSDKFEIDNGLDPFADDDFDSDGFSDRLEVLFYGSDPKLFASFPGDATHPAPGSFPEIIDSEVVADLDIPNTLGSTIINEATTGGAHNGEYSTGVTDFVLHFANAFPAAGSEVSISGFAWTVSHNSTYLEGDTLLEFYDPGADGVVDGVDTDTLIGTARGSLTTQFTGTRIGYFNFTPINFTSSGTGLVVKIQSTDRMRMKADNNFSTGLWRSNDGYSTFGTNRSSRVSIGGTATAPSAGYSSWQTANSTAGNIDDDHDGDGVENGVEYFLGGATDTTGFTPLPGVTNTVGSLGTIWAKAAGYTGTYGIDFVVETSATLAAESWVAAALGAGANEVEITGDEVKYTFPSGAGNFARLKVTGP